LSPDRKIHNQIDRILIDRKRHASALDVRSLRAADCDIDHYLVVAKFSEKLAVNKQRPRRFLMEMFDLRKLNEVGGKEKYRVDVKNRLSALKDSYAEVEINTAWETIRKNIEINPTEEA
jgi:hypothetical protein